jgi:predicted sulfurtransferase
MINCVLHRSMLAGRPLVLGFPKLTSCAPPATVFGFAKRNSYPSSIPRILSATRWRRAIAAAHSGSDSAHTPESSGSIADESTHPETEYCIVNFYHLVDIERPHKVVAEHAEFLQGRDVRGRIYISEQGINAQYGGLRKDAIAYVQWLAKEHPLFQGLRYTVFPADDHMFPKLRLKYKPNLISLAGGMAGVPVTEPSARATPVPPAEWRRMLSQGINGAKPLVLDVRNGYEWDAGHFVGAERPHEDEFSQTPTEATPTEVPLPLQGAEPNTPVMMYCTGGIRCDVYSAYLKNKGYRNLYTLEGGIQNYMRNEGLDHWNGSLFVFDGRMAIRPDKDEEAPLQAAAPCQVCGGDAVLPHANCANIDCNKLFIACDACKTKLRGCCCEDCVDAPRLLRPTKTAGLYGNWTQYIDADDPDVAQAMASGRGHGRISRRRKRQQALKEREQAKRVLKLERRRYAKEALAKAVEGRREVENESREYKLARLRELRQQMMTKKQSNVEHVV